MAKYRGRKDSELTESVLESFEATSNEQSEIASVLGGLEEAFAGEDGYEDFFKEVLSNAGGSRHSPKLWGRTEFNLYPGTPGAKCRPIVVAMVIGSHSDKRTGSPQIMRNLRAHLTHCAGTSKYLFLVTDAWGLKFIEESRQDLLAHRDKGLQIAVLCAADKTLTHLPVDL